MSVRANNSVEISRVVERVTCVRGNGGGEGDLCRTGEFLV